MIKNTQQTRLEVNFLKMVKGIHEKLTANILINGERQSFPPKTRLPAFTIDEYVSCEFFMDTFYHFKEIHF